MPAIMVDNSPATFRFKDGNPLSDGMASFAASIVNAGPAAAQVRRQREQDSVAQAFQQAQGARADRTLDLQSLWHQQANDMNLAKAGVYAGEDPQMIELARKVSMAGAQKAQGEQQQADLQGQLTRAQIANMQADNARATLGQFGDGINEAVKRGVDIAKLFQGRSGASQPRVFKARDEDGVEKFYGLDGAGQMRELPIQPMGAPGAPAGGVPVSASGAGAAPRALYGQPVDAQRVSVPTRTAEQIQALEKQAATRLPVAEGRASKTLETLRREAVAVPDGPQREALLREQRDLARTVAAAKAGNPDAIEALLQWDASQPDVQEQDLRNREVDDAMGRSADSVPGMYR